MDDPLLAVDLGDLSLAALVRAADDEDLVVLVDGDGADLWWEGVEMARRKVRGRVSANVLRSKYHMLRA